ncbi:MAG TPA: ATP-binding protein [Solirubrobacterales bacterium]
MNHRKSQTAPTGRAAPAAPSLDISVPATAAVIADLRHQASDFARRLGAAPEVVDNVALAVSEAVTNVVKHGYEREHPGTVTLAASTSDGLLEIRVSDDGLGFREKESDGLGLGLAIIAQVSAEFDVSQSHEGTELRMRFALPEG